MREPASRPSPRQVPADGKLFGFRSTDHDASTFVDLLDLIDTCYPQGRGHIVMDNLSAHDTDGVNGWFDDHPRWQRHFTPKHGSWLTQVECAFSVLRARVLARGSFQSTDELRQKVYGYMLWNNQSVQPFHGDLPAEVLAQQRGQSCWRTALVPASLFAFGSG